MSKKFKFNGVISKFELDLDVLLYQEENIWISYCPALELSSYGDTQEEAKEAFEEAVEIFFEETSNKGTLEKCLLKLGWQLQQKPSVIYNVPLFDSKSISKNLSRGSITKYKERVEIPMYC